MDHNTLYLQDTGPLFLSLKPRFLKCTRPDTAGQRALRISQKTYSATVAPQLQMCPQLRNENHGENIKS